jgi:hypothetical protein
MDHRFSEVFIGTFNSERAAAYFRKLAASAEHYRETDIYNIPHDGRTVRVAILDPRAVAVSNAQDTAAIHHIIDRHKELALPKAGPSLVRSYYRQVPFASLGWAILRTSTNGQNNRLLVLPGGYDLFLPGSSVVVASLRYLGQVQLRAEAFTSNEQQASRITEQLGAFLALFRSVETSVETHGPDQDVKQFFDSLKIEQNKERAILTANVPVGFLKKMVSESSASELGADQRGQENVPQPEKTIPRPGQKGPAHKNPKQN